MPPDCPITEEEISALVDDELCGREQKRVAAHVAACPDCRDLAGEALAGKRLLGVRSRPVDPPTESWQGIITTLDAADGIARAATPQRRQSRPGSVPALAGLGLVLIAGAMLCRHRAVGSATENGFFVRAHAEVMARYHGSPDWSTPGPLTQDVVSPAPQSRDTTWLEVARVLHRFRGEFLHQTLYRVGRTPISEFTLSSKAFDAGEMSPTDYERDADFLLRASRNGSVVAWQSAGSTHVLVGRTSPNELLALATARRAQTPGTDSF